MMAGSQQRSLSASFENESSLSPNLNKNYLLVQKRRCGIRGDPPGLHFHVVVPRRLNALLESLFCWSKEKDGLFRWSGVYPSRFAWACGGWGCIYIDEEAPA